MKQVLNLSIVSFCLSAAFCTLPVYAQENHSKHQGQEVQWGYKGPGKPKNWGKLKDEYRSCDQSKEQSPIHIKTANVTKAALPALGFDYTASPAEIVNNGHTIQVNVNNGGALKIGADEYKFTQIHFHTPSEEKINGKNYPMVAHFVHKNEAGKLAVVAVLMKRGLKNDALAPIFSNMPSKKGETAKLETINVKDILPTEQKYYAYMGSLTTPPCSDGVRWQVLKTPIELSFAQLKTFKKLYPKNARPVQPLNGRSIQMSE